MQKAVDRLARHYDGLHIRPPYSGDVPPEMVVAVLTSTAVDEALLEIALAKLALPALLVSINNSVPAVAHLCRKTSSATLIYGAKYEATAKAAQAALREEDGYQLRIIPEKRFPLWGKGGVRDLEIAPFPPVLTPEQEATRTCVILHSSGSTGFPKPVYNTHFAIIANLAMSIPKTGFSALPLFHGFGHFSM